MNEMRLQNLLNEDIHFEEGEVVAMAMALLQQILEKGELNSCFLLLTPNNIMISGKQGAYQYRYADTTDSQLLRGEHNLYGPSMDSPDGMGGSGSLVTIYSLGIVMYQLLNDNKLPYVESNMTHTQRMESVKRHLYDELPCLSQCNSRLADIVRKACCHHTGKGYQEITDMLSDLREFAGCVTLPDVHLPEMEVCEMEVIKSKHAMQMGSLLHRRYRLNRVIGSGGFGITYEAWDEKMSVKVAIKEYLPKSIISVTRIGEDAFSLCPNLVISLYQGTYAEEYMKANLIKYSYIADNDVKELTTEEKITTEETGKESEVTIPKVSKVKKFKAKAKKKALTLSWKKVSGAKGYKIQISTKKNFKGAKSYTVSKKKTKYTISKLKAKKKYYIRICAYKTYKDKNGKTKKTYGKYVKIEKKTK